MFKVFLTAALIISYTTILSAQERWIPASYQNAFNFSWLSDDILVDTGNVWNVGNRQIALKKGADNNLYLAWSKKHATGQPISNINLYKSTNSGMNWVFLGAVNTSGGYFGQISMLVENRGTSADSTRLIVFYTRAALNNMQNSTLNWASIRSNGTGFIGGVSILLPFTGHKFFYPTAFSDGQYNAETTSFGVLVGEYQNAGSESTRSLRFLKSTNWGASFQEVELIDGLYPGVNDYFPTADFKKDSQDSIYIITERRTSTDSLIYLHAISWSNPTTSVRRFAVTPSGNYERPCLTIQQNGDYANATRNIMITAIRNGNQVVYSRSTNSGLSWVHNNVLSLAAQTKSRFAHCSSDSSNAGGNFAVVYSNAQVTFGDSVTVIRGSITSMTGILQKINQFNSSHILTPVCALVGSGTNMATGVAYAGGGQVNVYYDAENLPTSISSNGTGIPLEYSLSQNYPNPFNPETKINFNIASSGSVKIVVMDMLGREVKTLVNQNMQPGSYNVSFNGANLTSGIYFYKMIVSDATGIQSFSKKMILVK